MISARRRYPEDGLVTARVTYESGEGYLRRYDSTGFELGDGRECESIDHFIGMIRDWNWILEDTEDYLYDRGL